MDNEIKGISCEVKNCIYHDKSNNCLAGHIHVGNAEATKTSETTCETFAKNGEGCC